jgi:FAD/FMN-containing dehydrogenase
VLTVGLGRSYGDSCLNDGGTLLLARGLDRLIRFNEERGLLTAEAGVSLAEILDFAVPRGWFLPVSPGTRFVTLGGAIANDVHGKNHHIAGSFGNHVSRFGLLRSDRGPLECSASENGDLFAATIGGLGLTGAIQWAELQLKPIDNEWLDTETIRFGDLSEFFALSQESERRFEYIVAWVDSLSSSSRGLFFRANHNVALPLGKQRSDGSRLFIPVDFPEWVLNSWTGGLFNLGMYWKQWKRQSRCSMRYEPFFYPLDAVRDWNRLYGRRGLLQWQCLVPLDSAKETISAILREIPKSGQASFLTVLKTMGNVRSRGWMSFPGQGVTLALDFPLDPGVFKLLERIDELVFKAGGRLYPAKDARMPSEGFLKSYPRWRELEEIRDPRYSSSFWRRVTNAA